MQLTTCQREDFKNRIDNIIHSKEFNKMKNYKHHNNGNTYEHSIHVAYLCYLHWIRTNCNIDINELIRGALLHDYFLYDWRKNNGNKLINGVMHGFKHSKYSLKNAMRDYNDLTKTEKDIIIRHMFPLTPIPPITKCGWIVCFYDKIAAIYEYFSFEKLQLYNVHN